MFYHHLKNVLKKTRAQSKIDGPVVRWEEWKGQSKASLMDMCEVPGPKRQFTHLASNNRPMQPISLAYQWQNQERENITAGCNSQGEGLEGEPGFQC